MQRDGLEHERHDHEDEAEEPDAAPNGVGDQAELERRLGRRVLDPHALEHAGQRVGQRRTKRQDKDHRDPLSFAIHVSCTYLAPV